MTGESAGNINALWASVAVAVTLASATVICWQPKSTTTMTKEEGSTSEPEKARLLSTTNGHTYNGYMRDENTLVIDKAQKERALDPKTATTVKQWQPSKTIVSSREPSSIDTIGKDIQDLKGEKSSFPEDAEKKGVENMLAAMTDDEKGAMPDEHMTLRHFRAENGDVKLAIQSIKAALAWRKEFEVERIISCFEEGGDEEMRKIIAEENATGKMYVRGFDKDGRAVMYMRPSLENTNNEQNNMRHLVFNLEKAIASTREKSGYEKINLMMDFDGYTLSKAPPMSTSKLTLDILQKHYPERMFKAYVLNPPFIFRTFWALIKPFIDPVTKEKIEFCHGEDGATIVARRFDLATVEKCAGGNERNHNEFNSGDYLALKFSEAL